MAKKKKPVGQFIGAFRAKDGSEEFFTFTTPEDAARILKDLLTPGTEVQKCGIRSVTFLVGAQVRAPQSKKK